MGVSERLAELAWQCYDGRFDELRRLIEAAGGETRLEDGWLWVRSHVGMTLGVPQGTDPVTVFVQIAFALFGPWWAQLPEARRAMELVNRQWRDRKRGQQTGHAERPMQLAA